MFIISFCINIEKINILEFIFFVIGITTLFGFATSRIHSFLAKNSPLNAEILVVEGWLPDYAIQSAAVEFRQGSYRKLITMGGSLPRGFYLSEYKTFAKLAAATLIELGIDQEQLIILSDPSNSQNRTYSSASILNQWLSTADLQITAINLFTIGTHARRSWLLFKEILKPKISVGIISVQPLNYEEKIWWKSSEGFRTVISELLAYLYVRLFKY